MRLYFYLVLFKYPKLGIDLGLNNCEFAFQNHILSPSILGTIQYKKFTYNI